MYNLINKSFLGAGLVAMALGSGYAKTYQLKKVLVINECGSGGFVHTDQINYTSNYYNTYLGPKYGFKCTIPATQADIDKVFTDDSLKTYDVVVFNGGTRVGGAGAVGDTGAQHAFQRYLKAGGGCVGIHGLLDHNNTWPWLRDSVLSGAIFTQHSNWGSDPNAQVQWDTLKTSGVVRSMKPEYDSIRSIFPHNTHFTYPDEWYSVSPDPRPIADVLMTIDETTYQVPSGSAMGVGHPVMWAYHLPPDSTGGPQGRFIYFARGHETGAWDGTSSNHAPETVGQGAKQQGDTVFSDTSHTLMTKGWLWQSLKWAAGLYVDQPVSVRSSDASVGGILQAQNKNGVLYVHVDGAGRNEVNVYTLSGENVARGMGSGDKDYYFSNLKGPSLYIVQVKSAKKTYTQRVML